MFTKSGHSKDRDLPPKTQFGGVSSSGGITPFCLSSLYKRGGAACKYYAKKVEL